MLGTLLLSSKEFFSKVYTINSPRNANMKKIIYILQVWIEPLREESKKYQIAKIVIMA